MADGLKVYKIEDSQTGKVYEIEGPEDATEDEIYSYLESTLQQPAPQTQPKPQAPVAPTAAGPVAVPTPAAPEPYVPSAMNQGEQEQVIATKAFEEVPGAREFLEDQFWNDKDFGTTRQEFNKRFPGVTLPENMGDVWAQHKAIAATPEGRWKYQQTPGALFAPVNRATGIDDEAVPDSVLEEAFVSGQRSLANMANTVTGAAGVVADMVGADETAEQLANEYLEKQAAIGLNFPTSAGKAVEIRSFDDFGRWAASVTGELVPQLTASLGSGLVGGLVGRKVVERKAADLIEASVANGIAREVAEAQVAQQIKKATLRGQIAGAGLASEVQEVGSIYGDTYGATGELKPWTSFFAGTAAASLDTILPARILGKVGGEAANTAVANSLIKRLGKEGAAQWLIEGGTEALQTVIEQLPAGKGIDWDEVVESYFRGSAGGTITGATTAGYQAIQERKDAPAQPPVNRSVPEGATTVVAPTTPAKGRTKAYKTELAQTRTQIEARIGDLTAGWQNAPTFEVHDNFSKLEGVANGAIGAIHDGKVVINTENVIREANRRGVSPDVIVNSVTFHEGLGHHGLAQLFGEQLEDKLASILNSSPVYQRRTAEWLKKNPKAYVGVPNRDLLALEEVLADRSNNGQLPASYIDQFKNLIKDFGRKMGLELEYSTREVETILGMAHAAVVGGKGRGGARQNGFLPTRYMYAGESAETANKFSLQDAQQMERRGMDVGPNGESRKTTGWFKGRDGKWRFEIDDSKASFKRFDEELLDELVVDTDYEGYSRDFYPFDTSQQGIDALTSPQMREALGVENLYLHEVFDHPELYDAYPELGEIKVVRESVENEYPDEVKNLSGYYDKTNNTIYIKSSITNKQKIKQVILHEVQHAIQDIEGFSSGGNKKMAVKAMSDKSVIESAEKLIAEGRAANDPQWTKIADELQSHVDKNDVAWLRNYFQDPESVGTLVGGEAYKWLAGEMEARDTESRVNLTEQDREDIDPYSYENMDPAYLIHTQDTEGTANAMVFHGSPHDFDAFDHSWMGKGEGAQVYGWGTYLTDTKKIAEGYRDKLSQGERRLTFTDKNGERVNLDKWAATDDIVEAIGVNRSNSAMNYPAQYAINEIVRGFTIEEAIANTRYNYSHYSNQDFVEEALRLVRESAPALEGPRGKLYEVEIPDDAQWIDWDTPIKNQPYVLKALKAAGMKPVSHARYWELLRQYHNLDGEVASLQQHLKRVEEAGDRLPASILEEAEQSRKRLQEVSEELAPIEDEYFRAFDEDLAGSALYHGFERKLGSAAEVSKFFYGLGFTGTKYLDGMSRRQGKGTYNYVMYNDKDPKIVNKYMMMSDPDAVEFTPEEIANFSADEIIESQNAYDLLEKMTTGYTPVVMSYDDLAREVELRGLNPSQIAKMNTAAPGELTKRLFMFDIAIGKINDRLSELYHKMQNGTASPVDLSNYRKAAAKQRELIDRIWDEQSELARALNAMKRIEYTRRRVNDMQQTLAVFAKGSPFEVLNDPDELYKYATQIQAEIDAVAAKQKKKERAEFIGHVINIPRALMSTMDLSAPLRQGIFLIHKGAWWRAFFHMFRYVGSKKTFNDLQESIANHEDYGKMVVGNLALSNFEDNLSQREELFMSKLPEKIPGFGAVVRASERAYVGFLNKLRADVFSQLVKQLPEGHTDEDLKDIGRFVNAATGRGNLPESMRGAAPTLNALFFSPRLIASRVVMTTALIDPRTYTTMNKVARKEFIKSIFAVGSAALLVLTLAAAAGAEVEKDPRSSDFAKIKIGKTRYDILGGEGQYITLAARIVKNSTKTADGQIKPYGTKFGQTTRLDAVGRFISNKFSPPASLAADYLRGQDPVGNKFEWDKALIQRFVPMITGDVGETMEENGYIKGGLMSVPAVFGVSAQTYTSASLNTEKELDPPDYFQMKAAADGEYNGATVKDGYVTLDEDAKKEWAFRVNQYYKDYMKEETSRPEWKSLTDKEKREIIDDVRTDARKDAKADMLEILQIEEAPE